MEGSGTKYATEELEQALHQYVTQALVGLLPLNINPHKLTQVLDLSCRTGMWACALVHAYPEIKVIGMTADSQQLAHARRQADNAKLMQTQFREHHLHQPLPFSDNIFDLVHLSFLLPPAQPVVWPTLLRQCKRVLKSRGYINLLSITPGPSSSEHFCRLIQLSKQLAQVQEQPAASTMPGVYFCHYLREAGFVNATYTIYPLDLSAARYPGAHAYCQLLITTIQNSPHYDLLKGEEFNTLLYQLQQDMENPAICTTGVVITTTAQEV